MWDECNCVVVWALFGITFLWDWNENWPFPVLWPLLSFPNFLAYWVQHFPASSFRIWNNSTGIPSPWLALFIVMLSKAHLTSHSRMSGSRWVIIPSWFSGSWRSFLYSSSVYSWFHWVRQGCGPSVIRLTSFLWVWFQCVWPLMPSCNTYHFIWVSLTLGVGYLFTAAPAKHSHCSLPWTRGISLLLQFLTFYMG